MATCFFLLPFFPLQAEKICLGWDVTPYPSYTIESLSHTAPGSFMSFFSELIGVLPSACFHVTSYIWNASGPSKGKAFPSH